MIIKVLIILGVSYLFYREIKRFIAHQNTQVKSKKRGEEELIQCDQCKTFFPSDEAIQVKKEGERKRVCSDSCKKKLLG